MIPASVTTINLGALLLMNRWKASGIHFLISITVIGLIAAYIIYFWYPPALISMAKADRILFLLGGIDLVVGPLLTLIVYKPKKPSLRFDLTVITMCQIGFLAYGLNFIYQSRPVFMVAVHDRFDMVFANEIDVNDLAKSTLPEAKQLGITSPKLVAAIPPSDNETRMSIAMDALGGGKDIQARPQYYAPYGKIKSLLLGKSFPITVGKTTTPENAALLLSAAKAYNKSPEDVRYVLIVSRRGVAAMLLDARTAEIIGPVKQNL
jgi:hypothetical protein